VLKRRGRPLLEPVVLTLHPAHWHTAQVANEAPTPNVQPASKTPLLAARSLQALLDH
jgi:hypothetical protein